MSDPANREPRASNRAFRDQRESFRPAVGEVPQSPGVYRFTDKTGRALYIGKAKNLRARIANYFGPLDALNPRTQRMLMLAANIDWTVVGTDTESLVLEHTWINEMSPPFNVQFRDDKTYPSLAVTLADEAPRLIITRKRNIRGARYFGPFPKVWAVRETAALLQEAFPIRTCNDATYKRAITSGVPCLASQIGRCAGPCSLAISSEAHRERVNRMIAFLSGQDNSVLNDLRDAMSGAAQAQEYERAAALRDQIVAAEHVLERNTVVLRETVNADVFGLVTDELAASVHQFIIRQGRIRGERSWIVDVELDTTVEDLMSSVLQSAYDPAPRVESPRRTLVNADHDGIPPALLTSSWPADAVDLRKVLTAQAAHKVSVEVPERGEKSQIVQRAMLNAAENLQRYKLKRAADIVTRTDALAELQLALAMSEVPLHIECIDISHLGGTNVVGSLVRFEDGLPAKSGYRHYRINNTTDDTASIHQLVRRRFDKPPQDFPALEAQTDTPVASQTNRQRLFPQLLIVDGGLPQVNAAQRALDELGVTHVTVCGIAKRLEEIWMPHDDHPLILPRSSEALFLVQRMRDEAHRFAISFQRKQRSQSIHSELSSIPGLGEKRIKALLQSFRSVKRLRSATVAEIESVSGISPAVAQTVFDHLNSSK